MSNDIIKVKEKTIACDGENYHGNEDSGHPKVYLTIKEDSITCPYCGRKFVYDA